MKLPSDSLNNMIAVKLFTTAVLALLQLFICITVFAQEHNAPTHYSEQQKQIIGFEIARELRCPMAVNQNLFDSQSQIASELKGQIFLMLEEGQSKAAIIDFMVARYGDKIRYMPPLNSNTAVLWLLPLGLVIMVLIGGFFFIKPTLIVSKNTQDTSHD
ncbi:Cytochrome c biogenesis protein [Shewanella piezotolerans WP3]|uniref:Cytochrome c-type biogenesis protein n=1 Tax=Shewanella piezotolerans (strain WP3 / JCM 13877) TaxID=225849 RepID=B8CTQ1_SHEPW|nr:cytochrome c-type biogenesis protein CcmH [Shewanella piezotolerans]ACJ31295.1 Cytochrome c biogenesis protein [Shewanella piezotolerans WP3]